VLDLFLTKWRTLSSQAPPSGSGFDVLKAGGRPYKRVARGHLKLNSLTAAAAQEGVRRPCCEQF